MANNYEALARMLMNTPQGTQMINNLDKVSDVVNSTEGQQLLTMLAGSGGDAIKDAAMSALNDDTDKAKALITNLLSTKEGAMLAAKLAGMMGG